MIPTSGTFTHTTCMNEFQFNSFPFTHGQLYSRVASGWPFTSESLRGQAYEPPPEDPGGP